MKLHIGGIEKKEGWKILNILTGPDVDFTGDITDLSQFADASIEEIYASHVLEHVPQKKIFDTVKGMHRVLMTGGKLFVSVPDMDILCRVYLDQNASPEIKYHTMRMMFGGQVDAHDFHYIGLNQFFLTSLISQAGFTKFERVTSFGIFKDTSDYQPYGFPISLNMVAIK
jgi:predicted SAM-dependent methyltransferase